MPHQCVRCGKVYIDGSSEIIAGCTCGAKLFFFIKKEHLHKLQQLKKLSEEQKHMVMHDVYDLIGDEIDRDVPVVLDLESINIPEPGKYELDLVQLFKKNPLIYKVGEGKYVIDLAETFKTRKQL
ncbi:hypothetical protein C4573_05720 [Candidatus Woesearchaeota archaeon]|nr:MAG: hypothetical protein C4573_05720 [Candidatus Woesearchaeota archaeon]